MNFHPWLVVALLACAACLLPAPAFAREKEPEPKAKEIARATVEAWENRGFTLGWMGIDVRTAEAVFAADPKGVRGAVPAFQSSAAVKSMKDLPPVAVPFGLSLGERLRVTDEDLT